jgi:riboflavin transporter FmnP
MNTKTIALTATLTVLTIVLNPAFVGPAIPAPFIPIMNYHFYEIPIVVAFLLIGARYGFFVATLNALVLLVAFPDFAFIRPIPNLIAISSMLLGVYLAQKLFIRDTSHENQHEIKLVVFATAFGLLLRNLVMRSLNYVSITYALYVFGPPMPEPIMFAFLFLLTVFDITLVAYTVPTGYLISKTISKNLKLSRASEKKQT